MSNLLVELSGNPLPSPSFVITAVVQPAAVARGSDLNHTKDPIRTGVLELGDGTVEVIRDETHT